MDETYQACSHLYVCMVHVEIYFAFEIIFPSRTVIVLHDKEPFEKSRTFKIFQPSIWKIVNAFSDQGELR